MIDYFAMIIVVGLLAIILLVGVKADDSEKHFFDITNSKAMRGFWCLIVILVHIPEIYQNRIQDLIGSFAFIGVTFFFMTSGYGLSISSEKNSDTLKYFWRNRLPKLVIPGWLVNVFFIVVRLILFSDDINARKLLQINGWVKWLIGCYFIFWLSHMVTKGLKWKIVASLAVIIASLLFYYLRTTKIVTSGTWTTECYGFIWGIILASVVSRFIMFFKEKWLIKVLCSFFIAIFMGLIYLKMKHIFFFGDYLVKILLGLAIIMLILIANVRFSFGNRLSLFLGDISYEVYLAHVGVFNLIARIRPDLSSGLFILASIFITVLIAFFIHSLATYILRHLYKLHFFSKGMI